MTIVRPKTYYCTLPGTKDVKARLLPDGGRWKSGPRPTIKGRCPLTGQWKNTWGMFPTCQIPGKDRHVSNVPHFANR